MHAFTFPIKIRKETISKQNNTYCLSEENQLTEIPFCMFQFSLTWRFCAFFKKPNALIYWLSEQQISQSVLHDFTSSFAFIHLNCRATGQERPPLPKLASWLSLIHLECKYLFLNVSISKLRPPVIQAPLKILAFCCWCQHRAGKGGGDFQTFLQPIDLVWRGSWFNIFFMGLYPFD